MMLDPSKVFQLLSMATKIFTKKNKNGEETTITTLHL